jgi:hypothetical protein
MAGQAAAAPIKCTGSGEYTVVPARAQDKDTSNCYALVLCDANKAEIRRVVACRSKEPGTVSFDVSTGIRYTLRLEAQGSGPRGTTTANSSPAPGVAPSARRSLRLPGRIPGPAQRAPSR